MKAVEQSPLRVLFSASLRDPKLHTDSRAVTPPVTPSHPFRPRRQFEAHSHPKIFLQMTSPPAGPPPSNHTVARLASCHFLAALSPGINDKR